MAPGAGEGARHDGGCQNGCVKVVIGIHYLRYIFNSANQPVARTQDISHCLLLSIVQSSENRNLVSFLIVSSGLEPGKLGVEFSSSPSPSSACSSYTCFVVFVLLLWVENLRKRASLCRGNLEQFYHIKQSIVFVLFHLFNFLSSSECRGAFRFFSWNFQFDFASLGEWRNYVASLGTKNDAMAE